MKWGKVIAQLIRLIGNAGIIIPSYMLIRRKGTVAFEKELRRMGLRQEIVKSLRASYKDFGDIYKLIKEKH